MKIETDKLNEFHLELAANFALQSLSSNEDQSIGDHWQVNLSVPTAFETKKTELTPIKLLK